ncbi:RNase P modulator RnpM [Paenibacillus herberti]|uniref:Nucleic-acid-binding protein n=1 Tax=Paenibacillus herberti TaxID=1619309 RepID=A0A229P196_9BACL|nr:YlxR family protein [Paenibacillus herberti]OXM16026.1 nucleic-acid-binding protein [Paenibacillus herberti]
MKPRKIPLRKCVASQEMLPKKELIRVVRTPDGTISIDLTGKKSGRGAYLKGTAENFRLAKKTRALDRALKQPVPPDIYDQLQREFISVEEQFLAAKNQEADQDDE